MRRVGEKGMLGLGLGGLGGDRRRPKGERR